MIRNLPRLALVASLTLATTVYAEDAELPVQGVTLYTSGVGFFEHRGTVDAGQISATLRFDAAQIDDLLKSLVVQDLGGGTIERVGYAAAGPLDRQLQSFRIDLSRSPSLASLLTQLKGARVSVTTDEVDPINGTVVGVEKRPVADEGATVERTFVTLFSGTGLVSVDLADVVNFEIEDEALRQDLAAALEAVAVSRDTDKRSIDFAFNGEAERDVRLGYIVETPIWKTSYRLLLGDEPAVQGWAIVENQTDFDWQGVSLGLVSGRPISFAMPLSEPIFAERPTVEVPKPPSVRPKAYGGGIETASPGQPMPASEAALSRRARGGFGGGGMGGNDGTLDEAPNDLAMLMTLNPSGTSLDRGALFEFRIDGVDIARQSSAMIPIVASSVSAQRVSLFDESLDLPNPLTAVLFENTTDQHLPAGPVTIYDSDGYAGEGRLDDVPGGQERLIAFGVDLEVLVSVDRSRNNLRVTTGSISEGVLTVTRAFRSETLYKINNKDDKAKSVVLLHALGDATVEGDVQPYETTPDGTGRFRVEVEPGQRDVAIVTVQSMDSQTRLIDVDRPDELLRFVEGGGLPEDLRQELADAAELLRAVRRTSEQIDAVDSDLQSIAEEQDRIRRNMGSVDRTSDYYKRLLRKLDEQETQIENLREQREEFESQRVEHERAYRDFVMQLDS